MLQEEKASRRRSHDAEMGEDVAWLHSDQWVVSAIATQTWNFSLAKYNIYCAQGTFPCFLSYSSFPGHSGNEARGDWE